MASITTDWFKTKNAATFFRFIITESYSTSTGKRLRLQLQVQKKKTSTITAKSQAPGYITWYLNGTSQGKISLGTLTLPADNSTQTVAKAEKYVTLADSATSATIKGVFEMPKATIGEGNSGSKAITLTKYTVTYAKQSNVTGTVPAAQSACFYNSITLNSGSGLSRSGYSFLGWSTSSSAGSASYAKSSSYKITGNVTLYPVFGQNTYVVNYHTNGGDVAPSPQNKQGGISLTLQGEATRKGYTFQGWSTSASSSTISYRPGSVYSTESNLDLYAVWKVNSYTLTLDPDGGNLEASSYTLTYDSTNYNDISNNIPNRLACNFLGWYTTKQESMIPEDSDMIVEDETVENIEEETEIQLLSENVLNNVQVYDANGLAIYDGEYWSETGSYVNDSDLTLYAHWEYQNIAYCKIDNEYKICNSYVKKDGKWYPATLYNKINGEYVQSII